MPPTTWRFPGTMPASVLPDAPQGPATAPNPLPGSPHLHPMVAVSILPRWERRPGQLVSPAPGHSSGGIRPRPSDMEAIHPPVPPSASPPPPGFYVIMFLNHLYTQHRGLNS